MPASDPLQNRLSVLESLLRQTLAPRPAVRPSREIFNPQADFAITATYFLLDPEPDGGAETFVCRTLARLLQQLSRSTEQQRVEYRGQVRGRVLWPATYQARYTQGLDPTRYVCREVHHRFDTPENQLLKFLMTKITECLSVVPQAIRQGLCYFPATATQANLDTASRLVGMEVALNNLWRSYSLREITIPQDINEYHLLRAETARLEEYALVARLYRHYRQLVLSPSWESLTNVGQRILPLPRQLGEAEDRWIRLGAAILQS